MPPRPIPSRADYRVFTAIQTRWADNDVYGHVNNATYYSYFDTAVNAHLIGAGVLDIQSGDIIGLVVETGCVYFQAAAFPEPLSAGLRVAHLGRSSVRYELAIFREGEETASAAAHFVHVYVDRLTRRPVEVTGALRALLESWQ